MAERRFRAAVRGETGGTDLLELHRRLFHVVSDVVVQLKQSNRRDVAPLLVDVYRATRLSLELLEGGVEAMATGALEAHEREAFARALWRRVDQAYAALAELESAMDEHGLVVMDEDLALMARQVREHLSRGGLAIEDGRPGMYGEVVVIGYETVLTRLRDLHVDRSLARRALLERVGLEDLVA